MTVEKGNGGQRTVKYLAFSVENSSFAIEVSKMLGIIQTDKITPIPRTEPSLLGLTKLRGEICAVIDLRTRILGRPPRHTQQALAISIEHENQRVCAVIDQALFVMEVEDKDIQPLTPSVSGRERFASSYTLVDGRYIQLLSVEKLFAGKGPLFSSDRPKLDREFTNSINVHRKIRSRSCLD